MNKFYLFSVISLIFLNLNSQKLDSIAPGGVQGTVLWMKTVPWDQNADLHAGYQWKDFSGDLSKVKYYNEDSEYIVSRTWFTRFFNFNPALRFINSQLSKEFEIVNSNLSTSTLIGAFAEYEFANEYSFQKPSFILAMNGVEGKGFIIDKDKIVNSTESKRGLLDYGDEYGYDLMFHPGKSPESNIVKYKERTLRSLTYYRTSRPITSVWGEKKNAIVSFGEKFYSFNKYNNSTFDLNTFSPNDIFTGYIPELFIYNRILTPLERVKAESYLAIKYGFMLENSFLGSDGHLLWDVISQKKYNHRVAGLFRDDQSGLNQRISSTSYEEAPYFSYLPEGDSYDDANTYNLSNRNKLLVIEKFPASHLNNKDYLIWGDNNKSLQASEQIEELLGFNTMSRKWKVSTNMGNLNADPMGMKWEASPNTEMVLDDYKISFIKKRNTYEQANISSENPLPSYEGHVTFTLNSPSSGTIVKFGTKNNFEQAGTNDYGIYINGNGDIYPIIEGSTRWANRWSLKAYPNSIIRIDKTKEYIIISLDGNPKQQSGQPLPQIFIAKNDIDKDFYVTLRLDANNIDASIKNFRVGGFMEMGNRIELAYRDTRASDFANYATNGQSYLIIDRSGTGNFKREDIELFPSDEYDLTRNKIIFNNIFFDTDKNQEDVFTFGYRPSNIIAKINKTNPSCNPNLETSSQDGKIEIQIEQGDPGFEYQLVNSENKQVVKEGVFYEDKFTIDSLSQGNYTLKLKELGGFNFISDSTEAEPKAYAHQIISRGANDGGLFEFTVRDLNPSFQVGMNPISGIMPTTYIQYGFEVKDGLVYLINNRVKSVTPMPGIKIKEGDKIQLYRQNTYSYPYTIYYRINGISFYSQPVSLSFCFFMIQLNDRIGGFYNVKNGKPGYVATPLNWNYSGIQPQPATKLLSETSIEHSISLMADCNKKEEESQVLPIALASNENLTTYYKDFRNQSEITAYIKLDQPSPITLSIFDFSANMIYSQDITESKKEHTVDINGLNKGVYILKVFSQQGEFSKKITIN